MKLSKILKIIIVTAYFMLLLSEITKAEDITMKFRVTSFWRSPEKQAYLLIEQHGIGVDLEKLYKNKGLINKVLSKMTEENAREEITKVIQEGINRGFYLSKHLCGLAVDIAKDKGIADFMYFMRAIKDVKILDEGSHFHIETTSKCN